MSDTYADLLAALAAIPDLPGAECKGRPDLFDEPQPGEDEHDIAYRHRCALNLCSRCPALDQCRDWVESLRPAQRPIGVIAGQIRIYRATAA